MKAPDLLKKAADIMEERGKQYDKPEGERSMGAAVAAFSCITGIKLTEAEGWLLLQILKDVRQWQNPSRYHQDSAEDCIAYSALKAEALSGMDAVQPIINNPSRIREYERDSFGQHNMLEWPESDQRIDAIAQNGNDGEHYSDNPSWGSVPAGFDWMAQDPDGGWWVYQSEPSVVASGLDKYKYCWFADGTCRVIFCSLPNPNWRNTLQRRPEGV